MSTVQLSFKTDDKTKQEIKDFAAKLGMPVTTFINVVVRQALRDQRLTLDASNDLMPTPYLEKLMREAEEDYKHDRNITHTHSPAEALAHLDGLMKQK